MKIGIIGSSGGSVLSHVLDILDAQSLHCEFFVITDRPCGIETLCAARGLHHYRIGEHDNQAFSKAAKQVFDSWGQVDSVLLFFSRLVTSELFAHYGTFNIHPSLLPAYTGFHALERACAEQARFLGSTLHLVNETVDGGPLVAQVAMPIVPPHDIERIRKFSFVQKVYLMLLLIELIETKSISWHQGDLKLSGDLPCTDRCNPMLTNKKLWQGILDLQKSEGVEVIR